MRVYKIPIDERVLGIAVVLFSLKVDCMQDTFALATHSAYAASRPSAARDDRVSCIQ